MPDDLTSADLDQLRRWDEHYRVVLAGDDSLAVWSLHKAGYLDRLKRRTPLYRLSDKGRATLPAGHVAERDTVPAGPHSTGRFMPKK